MSITEQRIARLEKKKEQLQARINTQKRKLSHEERKADTRRKILLGSFVERRLRDEGFRLGDEGFRAQTAQGMKTFIANANTSQATKRKNAELFREVFGAEWVQSVLEIT